MSLPFNTGWGRLGPLRYTHVQYVPSYVSDGWSGRTRPADSTAQLRLGAAVRYNVRGNPMEQPTMTDLSILATGFGFPEGPVVCSDGAVVLTEIRHGRCSRVAADGEVSLFSDTGGGPNGLAVGPDGAFYLCNNGGSRYVEGTSMGQGPHPDYKFGSVQRIDPATRVATTLYTEVDGNRLSAPNDIVFDVHGGFYFTDMGKRYARHRDHGGLYYALPDGSKVVEVAYPILSANGCGLSPDGKTVYVADTEGARLWAFDIDAPGVVREAPPFHPHSGRVIAGLGGPARFDSLAVMADGNITVATLNTGYITEISPAGDIVRKVKMPDIYPTNVCFGGADLRTAYVTLSDTGRLGVMQWPTPGLKLNYG
jgi:gluconolactonase